MADNSDTSLAGKAAIAAGAAIGSAAIAAALLYAKRRKDRKAKDAQPPATSTAPSFPPETD
jgi:Na+/H+-translocating membrane pyrophosphatase